MRDYNNDNREYYYSNTPWKRKLNLDKIPKFNGITYNNIIIFHYDLNYSIMSTITKGKSNINKKLIFVSAINVCLRYRQYIKKLYPYNEVKVIIYMNESLSLTIDYNTFKTITNILADFAVYNKTNNYFTDSKYRHIFYGHCNNSKSNYNKQYVQSWSTVQGNLIVR